MRWAAAGAVVAALAVAGCTADPDTGAAAPQAPVVPTLVDGTLTACVAPSPALAVETPDGWVGFDVDVLDAVADELALELQVVETTFDDLVAGVALNGGECDVAAGGVVADAALDELVVASRPYRTVHRLVVASSTSGPERDATEVTGTVGVEEGGAAVDAVPGLTAAEVVTYPSAPDLHRAVRQGLVDAALVTVAGRDALEGALGADVAIVATVPTTAETVLLYGVDAPDELVAAVDGAIAGLREDGGIEQLRQRWLRG